MSRIRFIQDPQTGELIPAEEYRAERARSHFVMGDLPDYESPIDGSVVHGRRGRREDLRRHGCRPYEGREAESREAARQRGYDEMKQDARLEAAARRAYAQLSPQQRRMIGG